MYTYLKFRNSCLLFLFTAFISGCTAPGNDTCDWPCFHGADRTNKSGETGLLNVWPESGPELLWTASGLGEGYSSVSISNGRIYTAGTADSQTCVFAFDLSGNPAWKSYNGQAWTTDKPWASSYTGSRSTPTYDSGVLYHLGEFGRLAALDAKTGTELWFKDIYSDFDPEPPEYGYAESVLIDGEYLYVRPAGKKGFHVCLDKNSGKLIWANTEIPGVEGYTSSFIIERDGRKQVIGASSNCYYGLDAQTGKLVWKVDFENQRGLNISEAILYDDYLFLSSGYGKGSMLVRLEASGDGFKADTVWQSELMDNHHGGVILHDGYLYGSGSKSSGWFCLDFLTGEQQWNIDGKGSLTYADGMLYLLDEKGTMKLVKATPESSELVGTFKVPSGGKGPYWAHPVVCGGRLYVRHADNLYAYDILRKLSDGIE